MDFGIFLLLLQDGLTSGAIYLLLAIGLLLVFSVTRVIFIPQGDFVAYGALGMAALLGPMLYRAAFRPLGQASVLTLLIVAMALHYVLLGLGLVMFGPEASRTPAFSEGSVVVGGVEVSGHSLWVAGCCVALVVGLRWVFRRTSLGRALRATASNPLGARLMGIERVATGNLAFLLAGAIGGLAGLLIAPITPIAYDSGFLEGLKGFIAAVIGGLVSYPVAAAGALAVGVIESVSSFWASAYSEAIVFALLVPVLIWLSLRPSTEER